MIENIASLTELFNRKSFYAAINYRNNFGRADGCIVESGCPLLAIP
ncbi:MAG: hypothetical protein P8O70_14655 [SAR324 cluster bacterium]|nr:hypothetical protein [SAR324 cluster bacterium]